MLHVSLDEAATRLTELVAEVASGETVVITKDGQVAARLLPPETRPVQPTHPDLEARLRHVEYLRTLTGAMPLQDESAGEFIRKMRDEDRY